MFHAPMPLSKRNRRIAAAARSCVPHRFQVGRRRRICCWVAGTRCHGCDVRSALPWIVAKIRSFSSAGGSTCGTDNGNRSTTERSSATKRVQFEHWARCASAASRSSGVIASRTYAPESSSNSVQVIMVSPFCLLDLYYDTSSSIDYLDYLFGDNG